MLSKKSKAIGFIIMSAFGFAMMAAFVRLAGDLPFTQKTFPQSGRGGSGRRGAVPRKGWF